MVYSPKHPLATKNGYVAEARIVLYDRIGHGWHNCHWCGKKVRWMVTRGACTSNKMLVVDHLDNDWRNNVVDNLVASCQGCNGTRWHHVTDAEVYITRKNGSRLRAVMRKCEMCSKDFPAAPLDVARGKGRFCSRSCARSAPRAV